jgi:hypothetical protein
MHYLWVAIIGLVVGALAKFIMPGKDPTTRKCSECLSEIPINARRCAFCACSVTGAAAVAS